MYVRTRCNREFSFFHALRATQNLCPTRTHACLAAAQRPPRPCVEYVEAAQPGPRVVGFTARGLPCLFWAPWCAVTRHHMLDISSVCLNYQDPSASAPESSDFGERCILQLQAAPERTTAFEAYGVWFARVVHSTPEQLGASGRFLAFCPFLVGCGGLARRLCGHLQGIHLLG